MGQALTTVALNGALTLQGAAAIRDKLATALAAGDVTLDCGAATEFDLSFVQLVVAARHTALRSGRAFVLAVPLPPALTAVLDRAGLGADEFWTNGGA
jgi:anti-anti-sigma regulatory factor